LYISKASGNGIDMIADGKQLVFNDAKPFIDNENRVQVPVRALAEQAGFDVSYENGDVIVSKGNCSIAMTVGTSKFQVRNENGVHLQEMDTNAQIINDRTYVPIRFIAEALGYEVEWK
jgi:uncharacterized protein YijF (DUF1287 family)